ncbi:MAG TPA: hypothetical protein VGM06_14185 [Polyangiaceae bacterium]|jgi:hypothetical protein
MSRLHLRYALLFALPLGCTGAITAAPLDGGSDASTADASTADGTTHDDAASDAGCVTGSLDFVIRLAAGAPSQFSLARPGTCGGTWLTITSAGDPTQTFPFQHGCAADCSACQPVACPAVCPAGAMLGDAGAEITWDGTYYPPSQCGAQGLSCLDTLCAPAGDYVAQICAYSPSPTCSAVDFTWPPAASASPIVTYVGEAAGDASTD